MKLIATTSAAFLLGASMASAQLVTGAYGSGTMLGLVNSNQWYLAKVWRGGSGRGGGHGHWVYVWMTKSLEYVKGSSNLGLSGTASPITLKGTKLPGTYGAALAATTSFTNTATKTTFNFSLGDISAFNPTLGTYNNAGVATSVRYVLTFTTSSPVQFNLTGGGPATISIAGSTGDGAISATNGALSLVLDPDYYQLVIEVNNSEFKDRYKNTSNYWGQLNDSFNLKVVMVPGGD